MSAFESLKLNKQLLNAVSDAGFLEPTPIQQQAIPPILSGQDVLGIAQTGTGKTAAYLLPILMKIKYAQGQDPRALILVPTRELVVQVLEATRLLSKYTDLRITALFGGSGTRSQIEYLEAGTDIVVATPGRLMDLYLAGNLHLKKLQVVVLDEAERLLDMGFKPQIDRLLEVLPRKRQNLLFSATWSNKVKRIAEEFLAFPTEIRIDPQLRRASTVTQRFYRTPNMAAKLDLLDLLLKDFTGKTVVFCKTKTAANEVFRHLTMRLGEDKLRLVHGNKDQNTRLNAMQSFRDGEVELLVTTDVVARGIDIPEVRQVVNFDVPLVYEDYIHRIGRTGRIFNQGDSVTFCAPHDEYHLRKIEALISETIPESALPQEIRVRETPFEEKQHQLREIDQQRRKEDPDYQGAFHEKKRRR